MSIQTAHRPNLQTLIYLFSNALAVFAAAALLHWTGQAFAFNLPRLVLVSAVLLLFSAAFTGLGYLFWRRPAQMQAGVDRFLQKTAFVWPVFLFSSAVLVLFLFLSISAQVASGRLLSVFLRYQPAAACLAFLGLSSTAFIIWKRPASIDSFLRNIAAFVLSKDFLLPAVPFAALVILKLVLLIPSFNGPMIGDEKTYFRTAESFFYGWFTVKGSIQYPLLYPLSIVAAFAFKGEPFHNIQILNVFYSSSIVFPAYLLARQFLDRRASLLATILVSLQPYHIFFPQVALSENLYYPLFLWAFYFIYTEPARPRLKLPWDILTGALIGGLYLTRYITLAIIPAFLLGWWLRPQEGEQGLLRPSRAKLLRFGVLILAILLTFSPWLLMGRAEGLSYKALLGFNIDAGSDPAQLTLARLLIWIFLYACFMVLMTAPFLPFLLEARFIEWKKWREGYNRFLFMTLALSFCTLAAVVRHSWSILYNSQDMHKLMGRYLVELVAPYIIIAVGSVTRFQRERFRSGFWMAAWTIFIPFTLVILATLALVQKPFFPLADDIFKSTVSLDGFYAVLLGRAFLPLILAIYTLMAVFLWREKLQAARWLFLVCLAGYYLAGYPAYYNQLIALQTYPRLGEAVAGLVFSRVGEGIKTEKGFVFAPPNSDPHEIEMLGWSLYMHGAEKIQVLEYSQQPGAQAAGKTAYRILTLDNGASSVEKAAYKYLINGHSYAIVPLETK